jgi:putative spermidine/putrescine transport system substrate-binding protein
VVLVNWGGDAVKYMGDAWGEPFEKDSGVKVAIDSPQARASPRSRRWWESGKVAWDVCDSAANVSFELGKAGLLEPIDYAIVDKTQIPAAFAMPWCVGNGAYSYVITYDKRKVGATPPQTWAEFWDLKRFPRQAHDAQVACTRCSRRRCSPTAWPRTRSTRSTSSAPSRR